MKRFIKFLLSAAMLSLPLFSYADDEIVVEPDENPSDGGGNTNPSKSKKNPPVVTYSSRGMIEVSVNDQSSIVCLALCDENENVIFSGAQLPVDGKVIFDAGGLTIGNLYTVHLFCDGIQWKDSFIAN